MSKRSVIYIFFVIASAVAVFLFANTSFFKQTFKLARPNSGFAASTRGLAGDLWADVVIGKRDFGEISPREVVGNKVSAPGGVIVDRSTNPGKMYVWDSGNSRILGVDLASCYANGSPCSASIVLGQPSLNDYGACNQDASFSDYPRRKLSTASTLCGIPESTHTTLEDKSFVSMWVDPQSNLFVPDYRNNRVLEYANPFATDTVADDVWGQSDFSGNGCNKIGGIGGYNIDPLPTASSLCFITRSGTGAGVTLDAYGDMWVADGGNNRVLRFLKLPTGRISKIADLVLGQPNFTSGGDNPGGSAPNRMANPSAVRFDAKGNLYVLDGGNNRILVFAPLFKNGMAATNILGTAYDPVLKKTISSLNNPTGLEIDPLGRGLFVYDNTGSNARIQLFSFGGSLLKILPLLWNPGGGGLGIDSQNNILAAFYVYGQDVLKFTPQSSGNYVITQNLFSPPSGYNFTTARRFESSGWPGVAVAGDQLVASDDRLMFWNGLGSLSNGKAPDGYIGAISPSTLPNPAYGQIKSDASSRIWVSRGYSIEIYQAPLVTGAVPIKTLTSPLQTIDGQTINFSEIQGLAPTQDGAYLWLSEHAMSRVFRIRDPLTNPLVDVVLGQKDLTSGDCNRGLIPRPNSGTSLNATLDMLCLPGALSIDHKNNLYISDHYLESDGNWRMLMFGSQVFSQVTNSVLYSPPATKEFPRYSSTNPYSHGTFEAAFDSHNRMVVGYNPYLGPRFPEFYNDPTLLNPTNPSDPLYAKPDGHLNDFYGWPVAATFDANDNLYMFDANRGQIRIYKTPFSSLPIPTLSP